MTVDRATVTREQVVSQARIDPRTRRQRLAAPLVTAAVICGAVGYVAVVDPNQPGHYPLCPTKAFLGIDCPGCGLMRGTHDLMHGNVGGALDHNVLLVVVVPVVIILWSRWLRRAWTGRTPEVTQRQHRIQSALLVWSMVAMLAFGVVRNFVPYLGSGIG